MKKNIAVTLVVGLLLLGSFSPVVAGPIPTSNRGSEYVLSVPDLHAWSFGGYFHGGDRDLDGWPSKIEITRSMGYIGYDVMPWLTAYITAGIGSIDIGSGSQSNGSEPHYGLGVSCNLIDKDILDPTLMEDKIRVTAALEYIAAKTEWPINNEYTKVDELSGSILVSIVNDLEGSKKYLPNSIAVFGGLLYSDLISDSDFITPSDTVGFMGGLEIFFTESISAVFAGESIGGSGAMGGLNVRF